MNQYILAVSSDNILSPTALFDPTEVDGKIAELQDNLNLHDYCLETFHELTHAKNRMPVGSVVQLGDIDLVLMEETYPVDYELLETIAKIREYISDYPDYGFFYTYTA